MALGSEPDEALRKKYASSIPPLNGAVFYEYSFSTGVESGTSSWEVIKSTMRDIFEHPGVLLLCYGSGLKFIVSVHPALVPSEFAISFDLMSAWSSQGVPVRLTFTFDDPAIGNCLSE